MKTVSKTFGQVLYALLFVTIIPAGLIAWAVFTNDLISFPAIGNEFISWIFIVVGGILMLWGMFTLILVGKGLPMNAYPPPKFVKGGPFRIVRHPIYWGFGILLFGVFMLMESASGIWMITPIAILLMMALVMGYEDISLKQRFPNEELKTMFDLPRIRKPNATMRSRLAVLIRIVVLLVLTNFVIERMVGQVTPVYGTPLEILADQIVPRYALLSLIVIIGTPFLIRSSFYLRQWAIASLLGIGLNTFIALCIPSIGSQFLLTEGQYLFTVPIYLLLLSAYFIWKDSSIWGPIAALIALVLVIIQMRFSPSAELHLAVSALVFLLSAYYREVWEIMRAISERIANSWKEWIFGKIRVINHGSYVGFAAFLGLILAGTLAGPTYAWHLVVFGLVMVIISGLWAQIIEGSEKLKRPFGYYGGLVGVIFGCLVVWAMGANVWIIIAVISVFSPWSQAIGRLRCLVNGCCHGSKINDPAVGIRYFHYRSRVCGISGLKGELLHPTQLYSILWLFFVGFVLLAMWFNHCSAPFIFGMYLILTSIGRFVEEAYRGEVQTKILGGLRLYQWTAIFFFLVGVGMTLIPGEPIVIEPTFGWEILVAALVAGFYTFFAMGVDFPYSNARFSRLV